MLPAVRYRRSARCAEIMGAMATASSPRPPARGARATTLVRRAKLWLIPTVLCALVALVLSLLYMGGIINPNGNLHRLPIGLVNEDQGAPPPGQPQHLGTQITHAIPLTAPAAAP